MSPHTPTSAPAALDDALARILDCPLNEPAWAEQVRKAFEAMARPPALGDFSAQRRLPRLSVLFDEAYYLEQNPDVAESGMEPYLHFLVHGVGEGRDPHPLVDLAHVRARLGSADAVLDAAALAGALADPAVGPNPLFDAAAYLEDNPDVREAGLPPLQHYIQYGAEEGRRPNRAFDPDAYAEAHGCAGGRYGAFVHHVLAERAGATSVEAEAPAEEPPVEAPEQAVEVPEQPVQAPAQAAEPPEPLAEGFFDAVHAGTAHGWAWVPADPGRAVTVEIVDEGMVVGAGTAAIFREDLETHGVGDGHHAFQLRLSRELEDGRSHLLRARVAGSDAWLKGEVAYTGTASPPGEQDPLRRRDVMEAAGRMAAAMPAHEAEAFEDAVLRQQLLLETGQLEAALAAVNATAERFPGNALVELQAAEALRGLGRPDRAIARCRYAVAQQEEGKFAALCWLQLGNANRVLGQWQEARSAYSTALSLHPGCDAAQGRLAEVEDRDQLLQARRCLADGDAHGALERLVPQLIRHPGDEALQALVHKAAGGTPRDPALPLAADDRRAIEATQLLRVVVEHLRTRGAAR